VRRPPSSIHTSSRLAVPTIIVLVAQTVYLSKGGDKLLVIVTKLGEHVLGSHIVGVVVEDALQAADLAGRAQRRASYLSRALCNRISHRKELIAVFVEQKVIVAKIRTGHVPVKILGLRIEREHIREQCREGCGDILCRLWGQVKGVSSSEMFSACSIFTFIIDLLIYKLVYASQAAPCVVAAEPVIRPPPLRAMSGGFQDQPRDLVGMEDQRKMA
jgi:hypothetical protein